MAAQRQADERIHGQESAPKALKRRGLVAGAAALVAGMMANRAAQPVSAGVDGDVVLGQMNSTTTTTTISNTGTSTSTALSLHCDQTGYGFGLQATGSAYGVSATGGTYAGVFGDTSNSTGAGVVGLARSGSGGIGVSGSCGAPTGVGVMGTSDNGTGVMGQTTTFGNGIYGVYGVSAARGGCGVRGDCTGGYGVLGSVSDGYGVLGQADTGNGLRGFSQNNHAIVGQTARPYFGGVLGVATLANTVGIYGSTNNGAGNVAGAYAGYFDGNLVAVHGVKSAAVPHPDGSHRLVYCVESPESWFEDFGESKTVGGAATVKLDADFAAVVRPEHYHVFLTPYGNTNGLHVTGRTATGFTVQEHNGGSSSITFSWRVVAPRKDITAGRLAKFDLPGKIKHDLKAPQPPQPPRAPDAPAAPRKP